MIRSCFVFPKHSEIPFGEVGREALLVPNEADNIEELIFDLGAILEGFAGDFVGTGSFGVLHAVEGTFKFISCEGIFRVALGGDRWHRGPVMLGIGGLEFIF